MMMRTLTLLRALRGAGGRLWRDRGGNNLAVEAAFIIPLVVLTTLGMLDIGRMVWTVSALDQAAREGARYAAIHGPNAERLGYMATLADVRGVIRDAYVGLNKDDIQDTDIVVACGPPLGDCSAGTLVQVTINVDFFFWTYGNLTGKTFSLTGDSVMTMM